VVLYAAAEKAIKRLPPGKNVRAEGELLRRLRADFGTENVKVVEKRIEGRN
jgi:DNA polymerase-3 subunit alpha